MKPMHTQTYIFNIHNTPVSQTPHQIRHTACKQVRLWDITCIIDVTNKPHQRKLQRIEEKLIALFIEQMHRDTMTFIIK